MVRRRLTVAASAGGFVLLAACEHSTAPVPALAPSLDARTMAAAATVGAPMADVQRASSALAAMVAERERAQADGGAVQERGQVRLLIDAAAALAATTTPENLPAAARSLDQVLRTTSPEKSIPRRLD